MVVQVSVDVNPCCTELGVAVSVTVGAGVGVHTVTVTSFEADPPGPEQVRVKVVVAVRGPTETPSNSDVGFAPLHPPDAEQLVALDVDQVRLVDPPLARDSGFALSVTVGSGGVGVTVTVAVFVSVPPDPLHASVYE